MDGWEYRNPEEDSQTRLEVTLLLTGVFIVGLLLFLWSTGAFMSEAERAENEFQDLTGAIEELKERKELLSHETDSLMASYQELEKISNERVTLLKLLNEKSPTEYLIDLSIGVLGGIICWYFLPVRRSKNKKRGDDES